MVYKSLEDFLRPNIFFSNSRHWFSQLLSSTTVAVTWYSFFSSMKSWSECGVQNYLGSGDLQQP